MKNVRATHLTRLDGRRIPGLTRHAERAVYRACREIARRTGCTGWYHEVNGQVQFHPGDKPYGGCVSVAAIQRGRALDIDIEQACRDIRSASYTARHKTQLIEESERENAYQLRREQRALGEQIAPDLIDRLLYARRKIEDPKSRPTVLVG